MRVVIDANVLIAAYAARGLCESIVELCISHDAIFLTESILTDVREKLTRKIKLPPRQVGEVVNFLRHHSSVVEAAGVSASICRDPDDRDILGAAETATADFIVAGDEDLLVLGTYKQTRIVSPRSYWEQFGRR